MGRKFIKALDVKYDVNYNLHVFYALYDSSEKARSKSVASNNPNERRISVRHIRIAEITSTIFFLVVISGCFYSHPEDIEAFKKPQMVNVTTDNYIFQPPDEIEVRCTSVPEINMQRQRIRPDGKVSFEALGEIEVAGKTPKEVAGILQQKVASLYALPGENPIDVRVAAFASEVYYVLGQVYRAGPRIYTGRDSVLTALAEAQPNAMAWEQRVQVVRPSRDNNTPAKIFQVNFKRMMVRGDISKDVLLQEGDIVYVPPTILAAIAMVLEEAISPIARAFYGAYLVQNPPVSTERGYYPGGGGRGY
jgi:protein involved in polysaccharide export with SLBB domain